MIVIKYLLSIIYYLVFGVLLLIFHPLQWLGHNVFGYDGHRKVVDVMNYTLVKALIIVGARVKVINKYDLPIGRPIVFVSNHQSFHDISAMAIAFKKHQVKFVSKIELAKGLPSISYNLRKGGSVLINRKDKKQALMALMKFGKYLEETKRSTVIYPEGTRSKNGVPKRFSKNGLQILLKYAPSALVVPVTINNSWRLAKAGTFVMDLGVELSFKIHEPIENGSIPFEELFDRVEASIKKDVVV